jgi:hypothetical protein
MHSISNRNFEIHIFTLLTFRRRFQDVTQVLHHKPEKCVSMVQVATGKRHRQRSKGAALSSLTAGQLSLRWARDRGAARISTPKFGSHEEVGPKTTLRSVFGSDWRGASVYRRLERHLTLGPGSGVIYFSDPSGATSLRPNK